MLANRWREHQRKSHDSPMKKIKIVFVLGKLENGGTEGQFMELVRRLDRDRFEVKVLAFPCEGKLRREIEALNIPLTCLNFSGLRGKFYPKSYFQLYTLLQRMWYYFRHEKPHIVQSFLFWANIYGCIAAKLAGIEIIITGRRGIVEGRDMRWHYRLLQNLSNRWSTLILTNSNFVRQYCLERENNVSHEKIKVIYNGLDSNRYYAPAEKQKEAKQSLGIALNYSIIGIVANLRPCKGHYDFVIAASYVLQTQPETIFVIIGRDGGIQASLEALARDLGIYESVLFLGEREDIPELLSVVDILVSASLTESLSNAILEGMAAGKAIVATSVGGTSELIEHEQTGLLVPPEEPQKLANSIISLLNDRELRKHLGEQARVKASRLFLVEEMVRHTESCYEQLLQNCKTGKKQDD